MIKAVSGSCETWQVRDSMWLVLAVASAALLAVSPAGTVLPRGLVSVPTACFLLSPPGQWASLKGQSGHG